MVDVVISAGVSLTEEGIICLSPNICTHPAFSLGICLLLLFEIYSFLYYVCVCLHVGVLCPFRGQKRVSDP